MVEFVINDDVQVEILPRHCYPVCIVDPMGIRLYLAFQELAAITKVVEEYLEAHPERGMTSNDATEQRRGLAFAGWEVRAPGPLLDTSQQNDPGHKGELSGDTSRIER